MPALIPYHRGKNWGFRDVWGERVVAAIYSGAGIFSDGLASVQLPGRASAIRDMVRFVTHRREPPNGTWGFINSKGILTVPAVYEDACYFHEGLAAVKLNGKWGFIDTLGTTAIPTIYDDTACHFSEGLAAAKLNHKWGFIDKKGNVAIPAIYDSVYQFLKGFALVTLDGKDGFVDTKGKHVAYAEPGPDYYFREGMD